MTIIESYRKMAMLSRQDMADFMGVSYRTYCHIENNNNERGRIVQAALEAVIGTPGALKNNRYVIANLTRKRIEQYKAEHPDATWAEMYKNIPNVYISADIMYKAYRRYARAEYGIPKKGARKKPIGVARFRDKYRASIRHKGRTISIGYYNTQQEAAEAWDKKAIELRGKNTKTNASLGLV